MGFVLSLPVKRLIAVVWICPSEYDCKLSTPNISFTITVLKEGIISKLQIGNSFSNLITFFGTESIFRTKTEQAKNLETRKFTS